MNAYVVDWCKQYLIKNYPYLLIFRVIVEIGYRGTLISTKHSFSYPSQLLLLYSTTYQIGFNWHWYWFLSIDKFKLLVMVLISSWSKEDNSLAYSGKFMTEFMTFCYFLIWHTGCTLNWRVLMVFQHLYLKIEKFHQNSATTRIQGSLGRSAQIIRRYQTIARPEVWLYMLLCM